MGGGGGGSAVTQIHVLVILFERLLKTNKQQPKKQVNKKMQHIERVHMVGVGVLDGEGSWVTALLVQL